MPNYIVDPLAENDLRQIWKYIANDNPAAANRLIEAALESFDMLAATPKIGKAPIVS